MSRDDLRFYAAVGSGPYDPRTLEQLTADQIMEQYNVSKRKAYELRREATMEIMTTGEQPPESLQASILRVLKNGPVNGIGDLNDALRFLGAQHSDMEVTKAVWGLQKRAKVTFYERKHGKDSILTKIKLTRRGMQEMGVLPERDHTKPDKVKPSRELKRPSKVGKDFTDEKHHYHTAKAEPAEIVHPDGTTETREAVRKLPKPDEYPVGPPEEKKVETPRYSADPPPPQNMKTFIDEEHVEVETGGSSAEAQGKRMSTDTHTQYPLTVDQAAYPYITDVLARADKVIAYEKAALALDGVDEELAVSLLEKIQLTDLEKEVVRFIRGES